MGWFSTGKFQEEKLAEIDHRRRPLWPGATENIRIRSRNCKPIKKNHIKDFGGRDAPEASTRTNSGRPRDTWDIWAWFMCKSILQGQNVPGTYHGSYHGTDGTCPRDRRDAHQGVSRQNSLNAPFRLWAVFHCDFQWGKRGPLRRNRGNAPLRSENGPLQGLETLPIL